LEGAFGLREEYTAESKKHVESFGDLALEVQFEHLMEKPIEILRKTAEFFELHVSEGSLRNVTKNIRSERQYSYLSSEELRSVTSRVFAQLTCYGY